MREVKGAVFNTDSIMQVDHGLIDVIKTRALESSSGRFRMCLHHCESEPVQQMIIAHRQANYQRPHRQDASKLYVLVEGQLVVQVFDDDGRPTDRILMNMDDIGIPFCVRLVPGCLHTTFAVSSMAVVCEVIGAANPCGSLTEFAEWAPAEDADPHVIKAYLDKLDLPGFTPHAC